MGEGWLLRRTYDDKIPVSFPAMNLLYQRIGGHEGISRLLRHFYADVRQDPLIGPIFNARIKDWKDHLEIIASFWETLAEGPRTCARPMPVKHQPLQLTEEHFERWLFLWQANCRAHLPIEAARQMIHLASHVAHKLQMILGISNDSAISFHPSNDAPQGTPTGTDTETQR
jgi:hemoglobin